MIINQTDKKAAFKLVYDSKYSGVTERNISILSPLDTEEDQYLEAYCFLRQQRRTFNTSNIISLTNLETGDVIEKKDFKFQFKPLVWMTKKNVSKSGNIYYYEKVGVFSKNFKPSWEKIGRQRFNDHVLNNLKGSVKVERDSSNEICYLEWHEKQTSYSANYKTIEKKGISPHCENSKTNTGCAFLVLLGLLLTVIIMCETMHLL